MKVLLEPWFVNSKGTVLNKPRVGQMMRMRCWRYVLIADQGCKL